MIMKNKIGVIVSSLMLLIVLAIVGGGYYIVNFVARPEQVRKIVKEKLEEQFPNSEVLVGKVDYSLFPHLKFTLSRVKVGLVKPKVNLFEAVDVKLDIPLLNILKGGGKCLLKISNPQVVYQVFKKTDNWTIAQQGQRGRIKHKKSSAKQHHEKSSAIKSKDQKIKTSRALVVPAFLLNSYLDIKIKNAKVKYYLSKEQQGVVVVERFVVKNIGLKGKSAFEFSSTLNLTIGQRVVHLRPVVVGMFSLHDIMQNNKVNLALELTLRDISIMPEKWKVATLVSHADISLQDGVLQGKYNFSIGNRNKGRIDFKLLKEQLLLDNIDITLHLADWIKSFKVSIPSVEVGNSNLNVKGRLHLKHNRLYPTLSGVLTPGVQIGILEEKGGLQTKFSVNSEVVKVYNVLSAFKGDITFDAFYSIPRALLYVGNTKTLKLADLLRSLQLNIKTTLLKLKKSEYLAECKVKIKQASYKLHGCHVKIDKGRVNLNSKGRIQLTSFGSSSKISLKQINAESFSYFLPENWGVFKGNVSASITSKINYRFTAPSNSTLTSGLLDSFDEFAGKYEIDIHGGEISKLGIGDLVAQYFSNVKELSKLKGKQIKVRNTFDQLKLVGNWNKKKTKIKKFALIGPKKKFAVQGKGEVFIFPGVNGKSEVVGTFKDEMGLVSNLLKKEVGTTIFPFRLVGEGVSLEPDYSYTSKKLAKIYLQKKGKKKVTKFLRKKLGKKANKILKNKKVKKLLKGLFD